MKLEHLRELAWEAIDSEPWDHAVCLSPKEVLWMLRQWPRGKDVVAEMRREHRAQAQEEEGT